MKIIKANLDDKNEVKNIIDLIYEVFVVCNKEDSTQKLIYRMETLYWPGYDHKFTLKHLKKTPLFFIAKEHTTIIGIIRWNKNKIVNLYIDKNKQGMNIWHKLLETFETEARKIWSEKIRVKSSKYWLSFYLHHWYIIIENNMLEKQL